MTHLTPVVVVNGVGVALSVVIAVISVIFSVVFGVIVVSDVVIVIASVVVTVAIVVVLVCLVVVVTVVAAVIIVACCVLITWVVTFFIVGVVGVVAGGVPFNMWVLVRFLCACDILIICGGYVWDIASCTCYFVQTSFIYL